MAGQDVEALVAAHTDEVAELTKELRRLLLGARPELSERVRAGWHSLNYHHPDAGYVCGLFPRAAHVDLVFERGALLPDPERRLHGTGRTVRTLRLTAVPGAPSGVDADVVLEFLHQAIALGRRPPPAGAGSP